MGILVMGLNHRTAPVAVRERLAFAAARVPAALQQLRASHVADEAVILSTCNRVEIYVATHLPPHVAFADLEEYLQRCHDYRDPLSDHLYRYVEPESVEHLFRVACGLDSMVLGETEILGQLKEAYELARRSGFTGPRLNRAFQKAFHVAKQIRTETLIQRGSTSVANVAVELAERIFHSLRPCTVLVIGAGDTSEKVARALVSRGAGQVWVTNRTYERAEALAAALGGRALRFEEWPAAFAQVDIVISSTASPGYLLDRPRLESWTRERERKPLLLIDIAVPRNMDPAVNELDDVYLYNVDDLQSIADDYVRQRQAEVARCEAIIREKARALLDPPRPPCASGDPARSPA
ncbi:MAG: glutamyl-tRNA reductase [Verrucomicrobiota bacterium]|nr:glutamyl-tRNA reductase [Limisphaera sp.]MDW8382916.1 glutamyl-tRNA reductase [Verrucomicrobiota bacterium]